MTKLKSQEARAVSREYSTKAKERELARSRARQSKSLIRKAAA